MKPIVHKDAAGLKMRITRLAHKDKNKPEILLLPMMHVADASFYDEMYDEKRKCHVVVFEGASMKLGKWAGLMYRMIGGSKKLGLTLQSEAHSGKLSWKQWWAQIKKDRLEGWKRPHDGAAFEKTIKVHLPVDCSCGRCEITRRVRYVRADLDEKETEKSLKKFPIWARILLPLIAIIGGLAARFGFDRQDLIDIGSATSDEGDTTDDDDEKVPLFIWVLLPFALPLIGLYFVLRYFKKESAGESILDSPGRNIYEKALEKPNSALGIFSKYLLTDRETFLFKTIGVEIDRPKNARKLICVEYGAAHMERLVENLVGDHGYMCVDQRSVLVVSAVPELEQAIEDYDYEVTKFNRRKTDSAETVTELPYYEFNITENSDLILAEKRTQDWGFGNLSSGPWQADPANINYYLDAAE